MFSSFHCFNYQRNDENWVVSLRYTVFFSLIVQRIFLKWNCNVNTSSPKPLRTSRGLTFDQNGMFKNPPFEIEYR